MVTKVTMPAEGNRDINKLLTTAPPNMFIRKLAFSNFTARKARVALTVAAVALSVSLVVAVTTGYASMFEAAYGYLLQYMGTTDATVTRLNDKIGVPWDVVQELRKDPAVAHVDPRLNAPGDIPDTSPDSKSGYKGISLIGIDRPSDHRINQLKLEAGEWFNTSTGNVAVVDQGVAEIAKVAVGDTITLRYVKKDITLKVVGIAHKPAVAAAFMHAIYLPLHTLQQFVDKNGFVSSAMIDLKDNVDRPAFEQRWKTKFAAYPQPPLKIHLTSETRSKMEENLQGVRTLTYLGGAVSMLAATFIIFSALSMGVSERQRSLAMLRAVGAFKSQVAGLVIAEGLILATLGLLIGVPLGWFCIKALSLIFPDYFSAGAVVSWGGVLFGAGGTLLTALAASLLPAWNATRIDPLEAMSPLTDNPGSRAPLGWFVIGVTLIAVDPFLFFGPTEFFAGLLHVANPERAARAWKFYSHFALGLPSLFVGLFLIAPMAVWLTERLIGPLVAKLFGLQFALLRQQLSSGIWRAAGTCSALMVGLAVLIVMQVTGRSTLGGWQLPDKFPDVFIGTTGGLSPDEVKDLARTPGLTDLMPIEIASVNLGTLGGNPFAIAGSMIVPDSTMFIAVDPAKAFDMMELDFRLGNRADAQARLKQGDWVLVTEEYRQLTHCKVGDPIELGSHLFHIAAVVWSPGIDVMKGMYDMGDQFEQRTVSSVFGSIVDGEKYFGTRPYVFCGEITPGVERVELIKRIKNEVHAMGLQVGDVREIKSKIENGLLHLLDMLSTIAFAAMAVASLGVANTIMAGVRSRRWQFGILRSIGVTRGGLVRLVLAEAMLLGLIGCVLGLIAGSLMSMDANELMRIIVGYHPPLQIPWHIIGIGVGSVLFISLAASLLPAADVARTEPLMLLQAGRSST